MADYMKDFGERLVDGGFYILPITPNKKFPGRYEFGSWGNFSAWERYCERLPTKLELSQWTQWPKAGIGIACGRVVAAIDIDILDKKQAYRARDITREHLGVTPACRVGQPPKSLFVYRTIETIASVSFGQFDILGRGRMFVGYGIHPSTQRPYYWPYDSLADLSLADLPQISALQIEELCTSLARAFPDTQIKPFGPHRTLSKIGAPHKVPDSLKGEYDAIRSALSSIPNPDLPYSEWMRIGMALKGSLGDEGIILFQNWSAQSLKNDLSNTLVAWQSFKPQRIGAGTIFYLAKHNGWQQNNPDYSAHPGRKLFKEFQYHG